LCGFGSTQIGRILVMTPQAFFSLLSLVQRTQFWQNHKDIAFNERQLKLLRRLLETSDFADGISRKKYCALTRTSDATAARDLSDLVSKGVMSPVGEGRGRRYQLLSGSRGCPPPP